MKHFLSVFCVIKRRKPNQHFVNQYANLVNVGLKVVTFNREHLWGQVLRRPTEAVAFPSHLLGEAKVCQLQITFEVDQTILGFQISVHDVVHVQVLDSLDDL